MIRRALKRLFCRLGLHCHDYHVAGIHAPFTRAVHCRWCGRVVEDF